MDLTLTYDREKMDRLDSVAVMKLINKHRRYAVPEYRRNMDYYLGSHKILNNKRIEEDAPNAQVVANHAKDISDTASGYFMGSPITYRLTGHPDEPQAQETFERLMEALEIATVDDDDQENALTLSICGKCYEYIYTEPGGNDLMEKSIDPANAFLVYDQSIEHKELFGVYYYRKRFETVEGTKFYKTEVIVMTDTEERFYSVRSGDEGIQIPPYEVRLHNIGQVPLIEYRNNKYAIGDFAQQIGLIDAYNTMTSDRINDKEQFIDAILVLYGAVLGDNQEESDAALDDLQKRKLLELPAEGSRAEYLVRQLDESGMEILRDALKEDIYTFSHVPNLTDENFAGNSSGVAMEYKLLGLEMLTKTKERWYRRGLRKRLEIFMRHIGILSPDGAGAFKESDIDITFSRSLPKNLLELSQIMSYLDGTVSQKTLLALLPFVENPDEEVEALEAEKAAELEAQRAAFGFAGAAEEEEAANTPPEGLDG